MNESSPTYRHETPAERLDRNWAELLQELRVSQPGVQVLSGFLLTMPFQPRFADLPDWLRVVFLAALSLGILATALMVAPVTLHRSLFALGVKARLVEISDVLARCALACLGLSLTLATMVVFGLVLDPHSAIAVGVAVAAAFLVLWLILPWGLRRSLRRHPAASEQHSSLPQGERHET